MWLSFQAGRDRAERKAQHKQSIDLGQQTLGVANQILAAVTARPTAPASRLRFGRTRQRVKDTIARVELTLTFETAKKLWELWRSGPYGYIIGGLLLLARWLGVL
jgi:hypothetical protein